jgi:predicted phosphodiesterase
MYDISPDADVIVLAGDISESSCGYSILDQYGDCKKPVIYVAGNHEYWGTTIEEAKTKRKELFKDSNIIELDNDFKIIDNIVFIGATLWTYLANPILGLMASRTKDFIKIKDLTPEIWNGMHLDSLKFIEDAIKLPNFKDMKKVVVTHYLPSKKSISPRFKDEPLNCIFSSNCDYLMHQDPAPDIWIHGHTHDSFDYMNGKTRTICNPYGYWGHITNRKYNPELLIEV